MRKMQTIKNIFYKLKTRYQSKKGVAIMEMAFFIPLGMLLLYMIIDMSTLLRLKYKVQILAGTVAHNTKTVLRRDGKATVDNLKQVGEAALLTLHGANKIGDYNLYIAWELVQSDGTTCQVKWNGYCSKEGNTNVVNFTNGGNNDTAWKNKLSSIGETRVKNAEELIQSDSSEHFLNIGTNEGVLVMTVVFNQNKTDGWYGISGMTYNIIKNSFDGGFTSQTMMLVDDPSLAFPPE